MSTSERYAFLNAIRANPDDDHVRLVYADWLDEHDEPVRARLIRAQCGGNGMTEEERAQAIRECTETLTSLDKNGHTDTIVTPEYERGFIKRLVINGAIPDFAEGHAFRPHAGQINAALLPFQSSLWIEPDFDIRFVCASNDQQCVVEHTSVGRRAYGFHYVNSPVSNSIPTQTRRIVLDYDHELNNRTNIDDFNWIDLGNLMAMLQNAAEQQNVAENFGALIANPPATQQYYVPPANNLLEHIDNQLPRLPHLADIEVGDGLLPTVIGANGAMNVATRTAIEAFVPAVATRNAAGRATPLCIRFSDNAMNGSVALRTVVNDTNHAIHTMLNGMGGVA